MTAPRPHIVVAGLARCGTSLTMQMLHAAGVPCIGSYPSFEVNEINHRPVPAEFLAAHPEGAFKLINPHETPLPAGLHGVPIFLDRDPVEQANSQAKFLHVLNGLPRPNRAGLRKWASQLRTERPKALARFAGWPQRVFRFENLINAPRVSATGIANHLAQWWPDLDIERMAAQVRPRSSDCAPGLDVELALVEAAKVRGL